MLEAAGNVVHPHHADQLRAGGDQRAPRFRGIKPFDGPDRLASAVQRGAAGA